MEPDLTLKDDQKARYLAALERESALRKHWESEGRPLTAEGGATGRAPVTHPLLREIREAEAHSERMGRALAQLEKKKSADGTRRGISSAPDRPGVLRAVK